MTFRNNIQILRGLSILFAFIQTASADNFRNYSVAEYYYDNYQCRMADGRLVPYYFDNHHLTIAGSGELRPVFDKVFFDMRK